MEIWYCCKLTFFFIGPSNATKRPGIVGMHPTGRAGKGCFESWPLCNFPIELAMLGYVVIVPDYPSFGDSQPYDFDADRYGSGTI